MLTENLRRQGRFVRRLESLQAFGKLSPSLLEQPRVYVDFLIVFIVVVEGGTRLVCVLLFPLFDVGICLELATLHELLQVELVSFGHLGGLFHADRVGREVGVLADHALILLSRSVFIWHRVLQVLGLHGLFALVYDGGGQHGGLPLQGRGHHSIQKLLSICSCSFSWSEGPPFLLFYL